MQVTTIDEARALVGRTFERDGKRRTVTRVEGIRPSVFGPTHGLCGDVYWSRPGGKEQKRNIWLPYFNDWLSKAVEVFE